MKIQFPRERLSQAFHTAASVAGTSTTKDILKNVKFEAKEGNLGVFSATDMKVGVRIEVPEVTVTSPGSILLPPDRFSSILRECPEETLEMTDDGRKTRIWGSHSEFNLPSESPSGFPDLPVLESNAYHEVSARFFREAVRRTVIATDAESGRYALAGVAFEFEAAQMTAVATDGRRLACQQGPAAAVNGGIPTDSLVIVPAKALLLIERALAEEDANVHVCARENEILVRGGRIVVHARLVEGRFPRWRDVFPSGGEVSRIELPTGPFFAAVRQSTIVLPEKYYGVNFKFGGGKLTLSCHGAERGESTVEMPIAHEEPEISIIFDTKLLGEFLRIMDPSKTITLELRGGNAAAVFTTDDGYSHILMPLSNKKETRTAQA